MDATGLDSRYASRHYVQRSGYKRFTRLAWPKLTVACHTGSHLLVGAAVLLLWGWAAAISLGSVAFVFFDARIATGIFVIMLGTAAALTLWLPRAVVGGRRPQPDAPSITPPGSQP